MHARFTDLAGVVSLMAGILGPVQGCGPPPQAPPRAPAVLRVPLPRDILTLDPLHADEITTYNVVRQLYEGLVDYDPRTLEVVPRVAREWTVSPDGLRWRFELHRGARFIDDPCFAGGAGRELTAEDARYSIERGLSLFHGGGRHAELPAIAGLDAFLAGGAGNVSGISTESSGTLLVELTRPDPVLLHFLARPYCRIVPREAVAAYGEEMKVHAVGTGPFRLVSWSAASGVYLVRNRRYWGTDASRVPLPYLDAVRFVPAPMQEQIRLFARGELDLTSGYPFGVPAGAAVASGSGEGALERRFLTPRLNTIYLRFDYRSHHPIVRDRRLRRAVSLAVPRPSGTLQQPARGLFPPGLPGFDPDLDGQRTDRSEAERQLREAGHPGGRGLGVLRLAWREWDVHVGRRIADALQGLGLDVELLLLGDRDYEPAIVAGRCDTFRSGWIADYPDAQTFLELFHSGGSANLGGYSHPEYDRLFQSFRIEPDRTRRIELGRRMERLLVEDCAAAFLHHEREVQLVSPRIENWEANGTNPLNVTFYERLRLRPPED